MGRIMSSTVDRPDIGNSGATRLKHCGKPKYPPFGGLRQQSLPGDETLQLRLNRLGFILSKVENAPHRDNLPSNMDAGKTDDLRINTARFVTVIP